MDNFIKNIKKKLSVDNLVDMMKDPNVIEENTLQEEAMRNTLQKLDPNSELDVDDIQEKLQEISDNVEKSKPKNETSTSTRILNVAKNSMNSLATPKPEEEPEKNSNDNEYLQALGREENVFNLYDDFH